jgi:hypothetical protein
MKKPNCYNCKYRGEVPGSAHSCCTVLRKEGDENNAETMMVEIGLATRKIALVNESDQKPLVKLNEHGVKSGWADWPLNFDPVWVDECPFETIINQK